jgi:hypothetical protein
LEGKRVNLNSLVERNGDTRFKEDLMLAATMRGK